MEVVRGGLEKWSGCGFKSGLPLQTLISRHISIEAARKPVYIEVYIEAPVQMLK